LANPIHTVEMVDGSNQARTDRLIAGVQLSVANAAGSTGTPVSTAVAFPAGAPRPAWSFRFRVRQDCERLQRGSHATYGSCCSGWRV
jgi:hypothetical protein